MNNITEVKRLQISWTNWEDRKDKACNPPIKVDYKVMEMCDKKQQLINEKISVLIHEMGKEKFDNSELPSIMCCEFEDC